MIRRPNRTAGAALLLLVTVLVAGLPLGAQTADSTRRWSLFGGTVAAQGLGGSGTGMDRLASNFELGGTGDFRIRAFPLPLRASIAVSHIDDPRVASDLRFGTLSLDAIARPVPKVLGTQLYLIGGLGVGTQAGYFGATSPGALTGSARPRRNWAFAEVGTGIDIGRMFLEMKLQIPVASNGIRRSPISIGFRF